MTSTVFVWKKKSVEVIGFSFKFNRRTKLIQVGNNLRVTKWLKVIKWLKFLGKLSLWEFFEHLYKLYCPVWLV